MIPTVNGRPVLLPGHCDDFGSPEFHYHIDWRYDPNPVKPDDVVYGKEVVYKELEPVRQVIDVVGQIPLINIMLAERYKGHKADCGKCPHHGLQLQADGKCPGHGLSITPDGIVDSKLHYEVEGESLPAQTNNPVYAFIMTKEGFLSNVFLKNSQGVILSKMPLVRTPYSKGDMIKLTIGNKS